MSRDAELDAFVDLLRSATPDEATLSQAKAATLARASAGAGTAAFLAKGLLALGLAGALGLGWVIDAPPTALPKMRATAPTLNAAAPALPLDARPDAPETPTIEAASAPVSLVAAPHVESRSPDEESAPPSRVEASRKPSAPPISRVVPDVPLQLEVGAVPTVPTGPSAPSETMAAALRDYANERYVEAAVKLQHVVEGRSDDRPDRVTQAEFFLAKCLYHIGLYHASAAAFDEVTRRGAEHPYFEASLTWLAMLAERLPEPSGVIDSVGRYEPAQLRALDRGESRRHYQHLVYLLGRARYGAGRFGEAVQLLSEVPEDSPHALEARFFEGIAHVRMRRAQPALAAFRRVIEAVEAGRTGGNDEPERMRDLAWMSVARLYYSLAMQLPARRNAEASELLGHAIAAWRNIPLSSEHWLDSFFEETWALYVAGQPARALGHVHALESPYFRARAEPEALVVRAMIQFEHCQWDAVEHGLSQFHARFDPRLDAAERALRMAARNEDAFRMLVAVRARNSRVPGAARPAIRAAFDDRALLRHLEDVRALDRERRRLERIGEGVLETSLYTRVAADHAVLRSLAVERTGELARARIARLVEALRERMTQMDTIELELSTQRRMELERPNPAPMEPPTGGRIVAVQGDQVWPWDGEWWRDELPFYLQEIDNRCGR
ncbi:MAG: hypothetical protein RLP09_14825 [Sandaracinaceae bacterium]